MKKAIILILVITSLSFAAFDDMETEAFSHGIAGISSISEGSDAIFANPAGLSISERKSSEFMTSSYYSNYWQLSELSYLGLGMGYNSKYGAIGLGYKNYGETGLYSENIYSLTYSRSFFENFSIGMRYNNGNIDQGNYGKINGYFLDFGLNWQASDIFAFTFLWNNFTSSKLDAGAESILIPKPISLAMKINPYEIIDIYVSLQNFNQDDFRFRIGQSLILGNIFSINLGLSNVPNKFHLGIVAEKFDITLSYSAIFHADLGLTNHIVLKYN